MSLQLFGGDFLGNVKKIGDWITTNWQALIIIAALVMVAFLCLILLSWLAGFWLQAIYGLHFDLASCWSGLAAVITGLGGLFAAGGLSVGTHYINSRYNSPDGMPYPSGIVTNQTNQNNQKGDR